MVKLFGWASLGKIKYGSEVYGNDFVVSTFSDVFPRRFEDEHLVTEEELEGCIDDDTKIVMVGTGDYGILKISKEAKRFCKKKSIELIAKPTPIIIQEYNKKMKRKTNRSNVTAIIHVKC